jgi:hypothetical protein
MKLAAARKFALSLPETTEEPHFELWSFRVRGKIFATAPPEGRHLHVFVGDDAVRAAVSSDPAAFEELRWGKKLAGVRVNLTSARPAMVRDLLVMSWRRKAPKRLVGAFDAAQAR